MPTEIEQAIDDLQNKLKATDFTPPALADIYVQLGTIKQQAQSLNKDDVTKATFLVAALGGAGDHIARAGNAFATKPPNVMEGSAEVLRMAGSFAQLLTFTGKWGGPLGVLAAEILGLFATVLVGLGPKQKQVGEQLRDELGEFSGEETLDLLGGVLDQLELDESNLIAMRPNSRRWDDLFKKYLSGEAVTWLGKAQGWLEKDLQYTPGRTGHKEKTPWLAGYGWTAIDGILNEGAPGAALKQ
jgi:hypothetical protein